MKILECSSKGDKRFSAFYAKVNLEGGSFTIESLYQQSKRFNGEKINKPKGKIPTSIYWNGKDLDVKYLKNLYHTLWWHYLSSNKDLVEYAKQFDDYNDIFKGKSINCQADAIREYIILGEVSYYNKYVKEFLEIAYGG
ncbi:MAG: hypothetical protein ACRCXT_09850 [Paraclostridium sp.]